VTRQKSRKVHRLSCYLKCPDSYISDRTLALSCLPPVFGQISDGTPAVLLPQVSRQLYLGPDTGSVLFTSSVQTNLGRYTGCPVTSSIQTVISRTGHWLCPVYVQCSDKSRTVHRLSCYLQCTERNLWRDTGCRVTSVPRGRLGIWINPGHVLSTSFTVHSPVMLLRVS
jgi:hypothetical protein